MLLRILSPISTLLRSNCRGNIPARCVHSQMSGESLSLVKKRKRASFRLINVSGFKTDLLEIQSHDPILHVLFIPGNPGVISFYNDFLESLYELLGGTASVTGIGHISHSDKNLESGRLFSLQEQIDHKISFIEQELKDVEVPIILGNHGLLLQLRFYALMFSRCSSIQYHTLRNVLFMAMTEFQMLPEKPDWDLIRSKKRQLAFLFGDDDHWGPLQLYEEIRKQVPDAQVEIEREGHTHAFSCTEAGSIWVAQHVSTLINNNIQNTNS